MSIHREGCSIAEKMSLEEKFASLYRYGLRFIAIKPSLFAKQSAYNHLPIRWTALDLGGPTHSSMEQSAIARASESDQ